MKALSGLMVRVLIDHSIDSPMISLGEMTLNQALQIARNVDEEELNDKIGVYFRPLEYDDENEYV